MCVSIGEYCSGKKHGIEAKLYGNVITKYALF